MDFYSPLSFSDRALYGEDSAIIWIDVETTGDTPETDKLLEIAACITDLSGNILHLNTFESLIHIPNLKTVLSETSPEIVRMHEQSGLWTDLWTKEAFSLTYVERELLYWINQIVDQDTVLYFGGNSITLDRNFVRLNLGKVYQRISHRSIDVTSLSIVFQSNAEVGPYKKKKDHRALPDTMDSITEYRYYLNHMTKVSTFS